MFIQQVTEFEAEHGRVFIQLESLLQVTVLRLHDVGMS
jgi:hypothetical protein